MTISLIDVNDQSPEFISANQTSVTENAAGNSVVMVVKAVDRDEARNGYVEYSLDLDNNLPFALGAVDGVLRVAGSLDREHRANYTLKVTAKDRGDPPKSTVQSIQVLILDENDNSPIFDPRQYLASVAENASIGASVLQVSYFSLLNLLVSCVIGDRYIYTQQQLLNVKVQQHHAGIVYNYQS